MAANQPTAVRPTGRAFWNDKRNRPLVYGGIAVAFIALIALLRGGIGGSGSSDQTWQSVANGSGHPLSLLVAPNQLDVVYAGNEQGQVLRTSDGGQTWTFPRSGLPTTNHSPINVLLASSDGSQLFAGTDGGVLTSGDNGIHWQNISQGLPPEDVVDALALGSPDGKSLFAGTSHNGIYHSGDGGATWAAANAGIPDKADVYTILPTAKDGLLLAGLISTGLYASYDSGTTWAPVIGSISPTANVFALTQAPLGGTIYAGTDGGIFLSQDSGATWHASNKGLPNTRVLSVAIDTQAAYNVAVGTDDGVFGSNNNGTTWQRVAAGLPFGQHIAAIAITHPSKLSSILYVAADQVYRFPGQSLPFGNGSLRVIIVIAMIGLLFWVLSRQNNTLRALTPTAPAPRQPTSSIRTPAPKHMTPRSGATAHIRGGPPPTARPPVTESSDDEVTGV